MSCRAVKREDIEGLGKCIFLSLTEVQAGSPCVWTLCLVRVYDGRSNLVRSTALHQCPLVRMWC